MVLPAAEAARRRRRTVTRCGPRAVARHRWRRAALRRPAASASEPPRIPVGLRIAHGGARVFGVPVIALLARVPRIAESAALGERAPGVSILGGCTLGAVF